jgi:hypothetical protein
MVQKPEKRMRDRCMGEEHVKKRIAELTRRQRKARRIIKKDKPQRMNWLNLAWRRCLFCGKSTCRRAIFHYMTWCCRHCDDEEWPKKVHGAHSPVDKVSLNGLLTKHIRNAMRS